MVRRTGARPGRGLDRHDGAFNVAADGVLPLSTVVKLSGRLRAPALETALRLALQTLWVIGAGVVPGAHVPYLRETCVADTTRAAEVLGVRSRYGIGDVLLRAGAFGRGAVRRAA